MTDPVTALRAAILPLLTDAGWAVDGVQFDAQRGDQRVSFGHRAVYLDEMDAGIDGPIVLLEAHVTSVEQAVEFLRAAKVLPPAPTDSGWRSGPPCISCGQPAARGLRHCPNCQTGLDHTAQAGAR